MRALAALAQFQPETSLKAWVFTILRNAFFEQARRRKREVAALALHAGGGEGLQPHHGEITDMSRMLWTLPPLLREALVSGRRAGTYTRGGSGGVRCAGRHDARSRIESQRKAG